MTSVLDKFTFSTTYRQDYGNGSNRKGVDRSMEQGKVDCKEKAYAGEATGRPYEKPQASCPCGPEGNPSPRVTGGGVLTGSHDKPGGAPAPRLPNFTKEELSEMMYKAAETGNIKPGCTTCGSKPDMNPPSGKFSRPIAEPVSCPRQEKFRPVPVGQFGGQYEGPLNRENGEPPRINDQALPYTFDKPCFCSPGKPENGPQDYGPAWIRSAVEDQQMEPRITGGKPMTISPDVANLINPEAPSARVSCAPEADVAKFDQPNTFMKKLYDKYPYLYQILRDTPPEELIARVFKDRFLSTYQVDYLHMGVGKESNPKGGEQMDEKFVSPEGEPEPNMIPGCSYRSSKKGDFGKKKTDLKPREYEEEDELAVKQEARVSEYMASISKLGGEIISDKLYALEAQHKAAIMAGKNFQ